MILRSRHCWLGLLLWLCIVPVPQGAERFGDVVVAPQSLGSGETRHGYIEHRVMLGNESATRSHSVTLVYPEASTPYGDHLQSMSRSAKLGPNSSVTLQFWQPALPVFGSGFTVYVDGRYQGNVPQTGYNNHARRSYGMGRNQNEGCYLISRSLSGEELAALFTRTFGSPFSPTKATGKPDAEPGLSPNAWMPAETNAAPEWLELDYDPPLCVNQINIVVTQNNGNGTVTEAVLMTSDGTPIATVTNSASSRWQNVFKLPLTQKPVGRVRLTVNEGAYGMVPKYGTPKSAYGMAKKYATPIDAVELVGPDKRAWATDARASSYASSSAKPLSRPRRAAAGYGLGSAEAPFTLVRSEADPEQWSDHWLAYSAYDAVILTARDHAALTESARLALWRYAESGGCLVVLGNIAAPAALNLWTAKPAAETEKFTVGFGWFLMFDATEIKQLTPAHARLLAEATRNVTWPWALGTFDIANANALLPVIADIRIPFRGLTMLLLLFVLLIGPVNLLLLSFYRRRIWSLWTIPLLSLTTCALIIAYSFLSEGVTPRLRIEGVTLLDQINHRATTLGLAAYYCPLTPGDGLHFSYDTELTPVLSQSDRRQGISPEMDWTMDQHLRRGWLVSRVPAFFRIRKSEIRRERLQLEPTPQGHWLAVNGLGAPIQSLWVRDFSGNALFATNVMPGQKVRLAGVKNPPASPLSPNLLADLYRLSAWAPAEAVWEKLSTNGLPPGTFLARLSDAPFLEDGLRAKAILRKESVVLGLLPRGEYSK